MRHTKVESKTMDMMMIMAMKDAQFASVMRDVSIAADVIWFCCWMTLVVFITWIGDHFFNRDARWVFFWSFFFGPLCIISGPLAIMLLKPKTDQDASDAKSSEEKREKARELLEKGPGYRSSGKLKSRMELKSANKPEPERYEL